ncbi:MAG: hypothetical protein ABI867_04375 [Kofleriaceae bacterium]
MRLAAGSDREHRAGGARGGVSIGARDARHAADLDGDGTDEVLWHELSGEGGGFVRPRSWWSA